MVNIKDESAIKNLKEIAELTRDSLIDEEKNKEWEGIRTSFGIYTEGKKGTYMIRPRYLENKITPDNLKFLLKMSKKYGDGRLHITTRQDLQFHGVKREDIAELLEEISKKGYFTKATGGNGARAIVTPPTTGFEEEVFDVTIHGKIITDYILEGKDFMGLPRKYKIALSNKEENSIYVKISDLGFQAVIKNEKKGFRVYGAGGLGPTAKESIVLKDFIEEDEILYQVVAIRNLFSDHGNRTVKSKARLRYILINIGEEEFLKLYNKYLGDVYNEKGESLKTITRKIIDTKQSTINYSKKSKNKNENEEILDSNIVKGKEDGKYGYYLRPPRGDIYVKDGNEISDFIKKLDYEVELRLTSNQKIFVRNLKMDDLLKLKNISKNYYSGNEFLNSYSCVGKSTCNLGILDTPPILDSILDYFNDKIELTNYIPQISLSGCPNSCATHQISKLGFSGKKKKDEDYFTIFAKGEFLNKTIKLNEVVGEIKAEKIPYFLEDIAKILRKEKKLYEEYVKEERFLELIGKYSESIS